jgi:hypothetical protein
MRGRRTEMTRNNRIPKELAKVSELISAIVLGSIIMSGCCGAHWISKPEKQLFENQYFRAEIDPIPKSGKGTGIEGFALNVSNKTDKDIFIVWEGSHYVENKNTRGRLYFAEDNYEDANNPKPPDVVFKESVFNKRIFPYYLLKWHKDKYGEKVWNKTIMPEGENGIYLIVKAAVEERQLITVNLIKEQKLYNVNDYSGALDSRPLP